MVQLYRAVPGSLPGHVRDEVVGEMCLAISDRRLKQANIGREAPKFIRAYWKANSPYETVSLDTPIGDGATTYLDLLSEDQGFANFV